MWILAERLHMFNENAMKNSPFSFIEMREGRLGKEIES